MKFAKIMQFFYPQHCYEQVSRQDPSMIVTVTELPIHLEKENEFQLTIIFQLNILLITKIQHHRKNLPEKKLILRLARLITPLCSLNIYPYTKSWRTSDE
jgi:hypothetical protein